MDRRYTTRQVADILGVTPGRVRQLADAMDMRAMFGRERVFTDADVRKMKARHTAPGPKPQRNTARGPRKEQMT